MKKIVILGAGLAGLSSGLALSRQNGYEVVLIEKDCQVGGLAQSIKWDSSTVDIGSHAFRTEFADVLKEVKQLCPNEISVTDRKSRIWMAGNYITYPPELGDLLFKLNIRAGLHYVTSYLAAYLKNIFSKNLPGATFQDWTERRFGAAIAKSFFGDYAEKVWGVPPGSLDGELARRKIAISDLGSILAKLLFGRSGGDFYYPRFYYPNKGIGAISKAIAKEIETNGGRIHLNCEVHKIDTDGKYARSVQYKNREGGISSIDADFIISTIPLTKFMDFLGHKDDAHLLTLSNSLKFRAIVVVYLKLNTALPDDITWLYYPQKDILFNRIYSQRKYSPLTVGDANELLCAEITCWKTDDIWNSPDENIFEQIIPHLKKVGLTNRDNIKDYMILRREHAYPVYEAGYKNGLNRILAYLETLKNLISNGRQGLFNYNNMDHSIQMGKVAADYILNGRDGGKSWFHEIRQFDNYRIVD